MPTIIYSYLKFIKNIVSESYHSYSQISSNPNTPSTPTSSMPLRLQPVYGIGLETKLHEKIVHRMTGYHGLQAVKIGNNYFQRSEHDTAAMVILAISQVFFDSRLRNMGDKSLFKMLEDLGMESVSLFEKESDGPWGLSEKKVYTIVTVACWSACEHLAKIAHKMNIQDRQKYWKSYADIIKSMIMARAFSKDLNCFVGSFGGEDVDATLLLLPQFNFICKFFFLNPSPRPNKQINKQIPVLKPFI